MVIHKKFSLLYLKKKTKNNNQKYHNACQANKVIMLSDLKESEG
jgi:hypothetical protein